MTETNVRDAEMRAAAVQQIQLRGVEGVITSEDLATGFSFEGKRYPLVNPQRGIFKPQSMRSLLSVRTVFPRASGRVWYDDQRQVHGQIHKADELVDYSFMVGGSEAAENRWLHEAMLAQVPVIYFLGVAPGRYTAMFPTFVAEWSAADQTARLAFGVPATASEAISAPSSPERRYGLRLVRQRLHQATFREAVLTAYNGRCAISRLPEARLLDAAHIIVDADEDLGQPVVPNGLPLSKVHHAAFDANLIAIDPDFRVHVSPQLLDINDGPMLEQGLKAMAGQMIALPGRKADWPDRDRLAARFEVYRASL